MGTFALEREVIACPIPKEPQKEGEIQVGEGLHFELTETGYKAVRLTKEEIADGQARCLQNYTDLINRLNPNLRIDVKSISKHREIKDKPIFIENKSLHVLAP